MEGVGRRECNDCPQLGADCFGRDSFVQKEAAAVWVDTWMNHRQIKRVVMCPLGYVIVRGSKEKDETNDQCIPCPINTYSLVAGKWSGADNDTSVMWVENAADAVDLCHDCPLEGAQCNGSSKFIPLEGFWRSEDEIGGLASGRRALEVSAWPSASL